MCGPHCHPPMTEANLSPAPGTRLINNTAVALATNGWAIIVSFLMIPLLVRGLDPAAFGAWALIQGFSAITGWASVLDLGLGLGSTRIISRHVGAGRSDEAARASVASLAVFASAGGVLLVIAITASLVIRAAAGSDWLIAEYAVYSIVLLTGIQASVDLVSRGPISVLDGVQRTDQSRATDAARRSLFLGASGVAAIVSGDLVVTLLAGIGASLVATAVSLELSRRRFIGSLYRPQRLEVSELFREARSISLLRPLGVVNRTMDKFILGGSIGLPAVGSLEVASSLQAGASAIVSASTDPITPAAGYVLGTGRTDGVPELAIRMTRIATAISTPLIVTLVVVPDVLLGIWLGDRVPEIASSFTALSCVALFISLLVAPISNCLVGSGRAQPVVITAALATFLNLILSVIFVTVLGALGVLVGTITSSAVTMVSFVVVGKRALRISIQRLVLHAWLPGLAPSVLLAMALIVARRSQLNSNLAWITMIGVSLMLTGVVTYATTLTNAERGSMRRFIRQLSSQPR